MSVISLADYRFTIVHFLFKASSTAVCLNSMLTNHSSAIAALEDLVCFPIKQMHTFMRYRNIPSHSLFLQEMVVNCYIFVALVS